MRDVGGGRSDKTINAASGSRQPADAPVSTSSLNFPVFYIGHFDFQLVLKLEDTGREIGRSTIADSENLIILRVVQGAPGRVPWMARIEQETQMADAPQTVPGDFNALYDHAARIARGGAPAALRAAQPAITRMTNDVPGVSVHLDEATHNPVQVMVAQGLQGQGAARLSTRAAPSPEAAARQFVEDRADLWQLNNDDIGTVNVVSVSSTGVPTVRMLQKVDGVEVFQSDMTAAVGADNNVVSVSGQLFHGAARAPQRAAARAAAAPVRVPRSCRPKKPSPRRHPTSPDIRTRQPISSPRKPRLTAALIVFMPANGKSRRQQKKSRKSAAPSNARLLQHHRCSSGRYGSRM